MRFYSFTCLYTSGIHAGIQTAHAVHEMQRKYGSRENNAKYLNYLNWVDQHKTIVVKQAGYHSSLNALYDELKQYSAHLNLPMIRWAESEEALNGATTAVAIIVPESVYSISRNKLSDNDYHYRSPEELLAEIIHRYPMAI